MLVAADAVPSLAAYRSTGCARPGGATVGLADLAVLAGAPGSSVTGGATAATAAPTRPGVAACAPCNRGCPSGVGDGSAASATPAALRSSTASTGAQRRVLLEERLATVGAIIAC